MRWLLVLATLVAWLVPASAWARPDADRIERLRERIAEILAREGVPGVGLALVDREGVIWAGGVGAADLAGTRPVEADTLFRVASITKSFVALAVARLHEQGKLDLNAPVADLLPDVQMDNRWHATNPITLAHLLEHTAGFDDMHLDEFWGPDAERMPLADVLAKNPRSRRARWRPGSRMSYANPGYTVAAAAIERVTGAPYQDVVRREVLAPLGITDAHFGYDAALADRLSDGHDAPGLVSPYRGIYHHPAGALITSPAELAKLVHHWLVRDESVVSAPMLARIERTGTLPYPSTDMDYGLGNYGDVQQRVKCRGHDGGLPGFVSTYRYCPAAGIGYVMLLNGTFSPQAYVEIQARLFAALTTGRRFEPPPRGRPSPEELDAYAGYYEIANPRHQIVGFLERLLGGVEVVHAGGKLRLRPLLGGELTLVPTADGGFRRPHESGTTFRFVTAADGGDALLVYGAYLERGRIWVARWRLRAVTIAMQILSLAAIVGLFAGLIRLGRPLLGPIVRNSEVLLLTAPGLAAAAFFGFLALFAAVPLDVWMTRNPLSMTLCGLTLVFAAMSGTGLAGSLRALGNPRGRVRWPVGLFALVASMAAFGLTLWLLVHRIIGLRTWSY